MQGQKSNLVLVNIRELGEVPSTDELTLYTSGVWSMHTLHLAYSKYYDVKNILERVISRQVKLTSSRYSQLVTQKGSQIKYRNLSRKYIQKSMRLGKYLDCRPSLEAYPQIDNVILDDNLGLNLYIISTVYHIIVTLDNKIQERLNNSLAEEVKERVIRFLDDY